MNAREKKLGMMLGICVGVLVLAFFALVIFPKYQDLSAKASAANEAKEKAEAELAAAKILKKNQKDIERRLANLQCRIPQSLELSNVINRIDEIAVADKLDWVQGTPEDVTTLNAQGETTVSQGQTNTIAPQLDRHDFSIVVEGNKENLIKFMNDLTDMNIGRIIVINNLDLQFDKDKGPDAVNATMKLQVVGWDKGANISSEKCVDVPEDATSASSSTSSDKDNEDN